MKEDFGRIAEHVQQRFDGDFQLPWHDLSVGEAGHLREGSSNMEFSVEKDERGLYLEYYVSDRFMWGDIHERVYADGTVLDDLETIQPMIVTMPGEDHDEKRREYEDHNRKVAEKLREAGLFPEHDINAHLRTNPDLR